MFEPHKSLKTTVSKEIKKKKEFKLIGSSKKRKGQKLFALDKDKMNVYEIEIQTKNTIDITKKHQSSHKVYINPKHPMLWAINMKNAIRKFNKYEGLNIES